jgi:hypothetical protein
MAITSPTSGGCSVGIVRSRTQTLEFFFLALFATEVYSASNRNEYQKIFLDVKRGRNIRLTT